MILYNLFLLPLENLMAWLYASFYALTGNYGLSIILLSLCVNTILLPLYAIAERLKSSEKKDREKMALELENVSVYSSVERHYYVREIYRHHHYHPLKSLRVTLGVLIQVPFFIAAYQFLGHYEDFSGCGFLFIKDLFRPDALLCGVNILPFVMTGINLLSAFIFSHGAEKSEKLQLYGLSALFLVLLYNSAAALVFYWTMNNVFSLGKSWFLSRGARKASKKILAETPKEEFSLKKTVEPLLNHPQRINVVFVLLTLSFYLGVTYLLSADRNNRTAAMTTKLMLPLLALVFIYFSYHFVKHFRFGFIQIVVLIHTVLFWSVIVILGAAPVLKTDLIFHVKRLKELIVLFELLGIGMLVLTGKKRYTFTLKRNLKELLCSEPISSKLYILNTLIFVMILFFINPLFVFFSSPKDLGGDISILINYILKSIPTFLCILLIPFFIFKKLRFAMSYIVTFGTVVVSIYSFIYIRDFGVLRNLRFVKGALVINPGIITILVDFFIVFGLGFVLFNYHKKLQKSFILFSFLIFLFSLFQVSMYVSKQHNYNRKSFSTFQERELTKTDLENLRKQCSLSRDEKNIIVIVLDAFPTKEFNWILEKHPEFNDILDGFTWYRNTVSIGNFTMSAEPALVGGHSKIVGKINERGEKSLYDVIQKTWKMHSDYFTYRDFEMVYYSQSWIREEDLIKNVNSNVLNKGAMIEYWKSDPPDYVSERAIKAVSERANDALETSKQPTEYPSMILNYLSLFKGSPYFLKQYIYKCFRKETVEQTWAFHTIEKYLVAESFFHSLNMLTNGEAENPKFHFFWLDVTIPPNVINKKGDGPLFDRPNQAIATEYTFDYVFQQLGRFFNRLKELEIYDNTNIILVGDHGSGQWGARWNKSAIYALLMVKEISARGSMRIDNETLMSNADLFAITSRMASGKSGDIIRDPTQIPIDRKLDYWITTHGNWDSLLKNKFDVDYIVRVKNHVYIENEWEIIDY